MNPLHCAAMSGSAEAINAMLTRFPELAQSKANDDANLLHFAAWSGSSTTFKWFLSNHPTLAIRLWIKDEYGNTPESLFATNSPSKMQALALLEELLHQVLMFALNNPSPLPVKSLELLEAFQAQLQHYLLKDDKHRIANAALLALITSGKLGDKVSACLTNIKGVLVLKGIPVKNVTLDKALFKTLLQAANNAMPIGAKSTLLDTLNIYARNIAFIPGNGNLTDAAVRTLRVIIDDYERRTPNPGTKILDQILISALYKTETLAALRPRPKQAEGFDIQVSNFKAHITGLQRDFSSLSLSTDSKRILRETIFPGLFHIIKHEEDIITHFKTRYGVLYMLSDHLPLHTDHNPAATPEAFRATLHRTLTAFISSAYTAKELGKLAEFLDKLTSGYCLEGRMRDACHWVATYSELKPFTQLMESAVADYAAYYTIMHGKCPIELSNLDNALAFILPRYQSLPCLRDDTYAPDSEVSKAGVRSFLTDVLAYDNEPVAISHVLKLLNKRIQELSNAYFFQEIADSKRNALISLRIAIANAGTTPLRTIIAQWKAAPSPKADLTNAALIVKPRNPFVFFTAATRTEVLLDEIVRISS